MNIKKGKYIFIVIALFFLGLQFREVFFTNFDEHLTSGLASEELNLTEIIVKLLLERGFLFFGLMIIFEQWPFGLTGIFLLIVALFWDKIRPYFEPKKNL